MSLPFLVIALLTAANYWILKGYLASWEAEVLCAWWRRTRTAGAKESCMLKAWTRKEAQTVSVAQFMGSENNRLPLFKWKRYTADGLLRRFPYALLARTFNYRNYPSFFWHFADVILYSCSFWGRSLPCQDGLPIPIAHSFAPELTRAYHQT